MQIEFEDYKNKLNALLPKLEALGVSLQLDEARNEVEKLEEETFIRIVTGAVDLDEGFSTYVSNWNAQGGEAILAEIEAQVS